MHSCCDGETNNFDVASALLRALDWVVLKPAVAKIQA